jgi:hypothetical protein
MKAKTVIAMTPNERKAAERARQREAGLVLRQIWVLPEDWDRVQKYLARIAKERAK